ncbi:MAG: choline dehydrogenase [Hyphomonadaceae bacterium]|nr:choline dehydrogenase [Hyphomonadaceae bacterium]
MAAGTSSSGRFDYVVVGAGSAGATIAHRLAEDPHRRILLLEAGPRDNKLLVRMPAGVGELHGRRLYEWDYATEPQTNLNGRRLPQPRGKILGGSSSINGMIFIRGHALDYDRWEAEGAHGWSYQDVLPYFRKLESHTGRLSPYRGTDGPVGTLKGPCHNPLFGAFIRAGEQAGYPVTSDVNGYQQEGFGPYDANIKDGYRHSASLAYLQAPPENLTIATEADAKSLIIENGRAVGVTYTQAGQERQAYAESEVIVSSGAIGSPMLLLRSGIGPAEDLHALGIPVVADLPGVGQNLHDHLEIQFDFGCQQPITLYREFQPHTQIMIGLRWLLNRTGPCAQNHLEAGAFIRSRPGIRHPDIQYHFMPMCLTDPRKFKITEHGFRVHVGPLRTKSRGFVKLRSADPDARPIIDPNHMSHEDDWTEMRACFDHTREIFSQKAFEPYIGREIWPGTNVSTREEQDEYVRARSVSAHHLCGTCRMGSDEEAVVDPECRVRGIDGLRVADASIIPSITSGNLHAPSLMIGEKAADHIRGFGMEAPLPLPHYQAENWQTAQR